MKKVSKIILLIIFNILFFIDIDLTVKNLAYQQNQYNVKSVIYCLKQLNPKNEKELMKDAKICMYKQRNLGPTGDMFLMDMNKHILFDASSDCKMDLNKSYLKKGYICSLFTKPKTCEYGSDYMIKNKNGFFQWQFDDSKEYIYFEKMNLNNKTYIIASGGENDEIYSYFLTQIITVIIFDIVMLFFIWRNTCIIEL